MKIFGWAADQQGCGYYRLGLPFSELARHGHHTLGATRLPDDIDTYDVIVGQRVCNPAPTETWQRMAAEGRTLVYEIDDDLLNVAVANELAHAFFNKPEIQANLLRNVEVSTAVTVSTEPLAEVMRQHHDRVYVIPNHIPGWLLEHARPRRDRLTIGWQGSATHAMDFAEVAQPVRRFLTRNPKTDIHFIGSEFLKLVGRPPKAGTGFRWTLPPGTRFTPWQHSVEDYYRTLDFDISLAPLRPHVFNQAKSGIRVMEASALGIPSIASDLAPYQPYVIDGVTGYLVSRPHEWESRLRQLAGDQDLREEIGAKAREAARAWTIETGWQLWEQAYTEILEGR